MQATHTIAGDLAALVPSPVSPGIYNAAAAITFTGKLLFQAQAYATIAAPGGRIIFITDDTTVDTPVSHWYFDIRAAFATAAASKMEFVIGTEPVTHPDDIEALAKLVLWDVTGAISLGASSTAIGHMRASGAIAVGASVTCHSLESKAGAVTLGAGATSGDVNAAGAIGLGAGAKSGILNAGGAITLGARATALTATTEAATSLGAGASLPGLLAASLGGMTLAPGEYEAAAAVGLTGTLQLDATGYSLDTTTGLLKKGDATVDVGTFLTDIGEIFGEPTKPLWKFITGGALNTAAASTMVFVSSDPYPDGVIVDGTDLYKVGADTDLYEALAKLVFWKVTGAITLGASSIAIGHMDASAAITLGANAIGGSLVAGAAITLGANASYLSVDATTVNIGAGAHQVGAAAPLAADWVGLTFEPNPQPAEPPYERAAATTLSGTLYLDAGTYTVGTDYDNLSGMSGSDDLWLFEIGGAFTTAAGSTMVFLSDGSNKASIIPVESARYKALAQRVLWDVTGAITLGAGSTAIGHMKATGAITTGAGAISGDLQSTAGAITLGADAKSGQVNAAGAVTMGAGAVADSVSSEAAVTLGAGAFAVHSLAADVGGMSLVPGTYNSAAAVGLTGTLTLKNPDSIDAPVWTFTVGAAFTTAAASQMVFDYDSRAAGGGTVIWDVTGAITLGAGSAALGTMKTKAAITVGASATCGALEAGGAVTVGANTGYFSADGSAVTLGAGATKNTPANRGLLGLPPLLSDSE
jgi:hypothetical protein